MPVHKVGRDCYQWGRHGKVYCGKGAYEKAARQGRAAYSHGYQGAHEGSSPPLSITEYGVAFETGRPVTFHFVRGTTPAPRPSPEDPYQQRVEPAGRYMIHNPNPGDLPLGWESGVVHFENPLVLPLNSQPGGRVYDEHSWKMELSRMFRGKTGPALSRALTRAGYDGVVTVALDAHGRPEDTREIVALTPQASEQHEGGRLHERRRAVWTHGVFAELFDVDGNSVWIQISKHKSEHAALDYAEKMTNRLRGGRGRRPRPFIAHRYIISSGTRLEVRPL